jgi:hypothetical protein
VNVSIRSRRKVSISVAVGQRPREGRWIGSGVLSLRVDEYALEPQAAVEQPSEIEEVASFRAVEKELRQAAVAS